MRNKQLPCKVDSPRNDCASQNASQLQSQRFLESERTVAAPQVAIVAVVATDADASMHSASYRPSAISQSTLSAATHLHIGTCGVP